MYWRKLVKRGRPKTDCKKQALTVRYDDDVVAAFKATGKGWQTENKGYARLKLILVQIMICCFYRQLIHR
ncbi:BrnA antitoxin family protein [Alishewanella longhuensis]